MYLRGKKHTLPIVNDIKLAPYQPSTNQSPTHNTFTRKKSIEVIIEKYQHPGISINDQILIYDKPLRKTNYKPQRRKAQSGYLKNAAKIEVQQKKLDSKLLTRNKSTQLGEKMSEKIEAFQQRRKGESQYSPYLLAQYKKSRSNTKFRAALGIAEETIQRDWICQKFIENEVYAIDQGNDFS